jgi:hypothetical protein
MRPRTSLAAVAAAAALTFALGGCFSASPSAPAAEESALPAISVEPATGELIEGTGYTVNAPEGWAVPPDAPPGADIYLIDEDPNANGFTNTLNVILGPDPGDTPAEIETKGVAYLESVVGATEVEVRPRVTIAGSETAHISAQLSRQGITYRTEQYLLTDAGLVYTITFSFGETIPQGDREALAESVLATWTWATPTTSAGYVYEDADAGYAVTFPGEPHVAPLQINGTDRSANLVTYGAPSTVAYMSRGEVRNLPADLRDELFKYLGSVSSGQVGASSTELGGLPALQAEFVGPNGIDATTIVAGDGDRFYQLIAVAGTPEDRQAFFDSFKLLG